MSKTAMIVSYDEMTAKECGEALAELAAELVDPGRTRALYILCYELGLISDRLDSFEDFA